MLVDRGRFNSDEEYDNYLRNEQASIDDKCYNPDPLTQYLNRRNYYEMERKAKEDPNGK